MLDSEIWILIYACVVKAAHRKSSLQDIENDLAIHHGQQNLDLVDLMLFDLKEILFQHHLGTAWTERISLGF
jgi:hypothetical protein